jgi:nitrate/nitrite transporter NarK
MQDVLGYNSLQVAVHLLPLGIVGVIVDIGTGLILHCVNNKLLTAIAAVSYIVGAILLAVMKEGNSYWSYIFPSLILGVIGAEVEFNVANVRSPIPSLNLTDDVDVCNVLYGP